jgi:hypothetical protein
VTYEAANPIFEYMRRFERALDEVQHDLRYTREGIRDLGKRVIAIGKRLAGINRRLHRIEEPAGRIERRLDLAEG